MNLTRMKKLILIGIALMIFLNLVSFVHAAGCSNPAYENDFSSVGLPQTTAGSPTISGGVWSASGGGTRQGYWANDGTYTIVTRMKGSSIGGEYAKIAPFSAYFDDQPIRLDFMGGTTLRVTNWMNDGYGGCGNHGSATLVSNAADTWHQYTIEMNTEYIKIWQDSTLIYGPVAYSCPSVGRNGDPGIGQSSGTVQFDYFYVYSGVSCGPGFACGAGQYDTGEGCSDVGTGYYSPDGDGLRYACPTNSVSSGSGTGADALGDCLGNAGYYNCEDGTCDVAGAGYYSASGSNSRAQCSAGYYCSTTTNSASTGNGQCTAGYYCPAGSSSATQNACGAGNYCPTGSSSTTQCSAGYYGSSTTNSVSTCNGACTAGYYCPAGSTSATQNACGANKYCPAASGSATACASNSGSGGRTTQDEATDCNCDGGYYDADAGSQSCGVVGTGYYSASDSDSRAQCDAGRYGSTTTNSASTCNGACTAGNYCPAGSSSATQNACGANNYCPATAGSATACPSSSGTDSLTTEDAQTDCHCDTDYYDTDGDTDGRACTGAGAGYYSTSYSDTRTGCTNKPGNSDYNGTGSGANNCPYRCIADLVSASLCTQTGLNKIITFINNVTSYDNLTVESGSEIHLNSSNITVGKIVMNTTGDQFFISQNSQLIINGSA